MNTQMGVPSCIIAEMANQYEASQNIGEICTYPVATSLGTGASTTRVSTTSSAGSLSLASASMLIFLVVLLL